MVTAIFPLTFTDEEGSRHLLSTVQDVETTVEFLDDRDPPYQCVDADGRRTRLIVWNLRLLVCQVVPAEFTATGITIQERSRGEETVLFEAFAGIELRALRFRGGQVVDAEPAEWDLSMGDVAGPIGSSALTPDEFHEQWMRFRLKGAFP